MHYRILFSNTPNIRKKLCLCANQLLNHCMHICLMMMHFEYSENNLQTKKKKKKYIWYAIYRDVYKKCTVRTEFFPRYKGIEFIANLNIIGLVSIYNLFNKSDPTLQDDYSELDEKYVWRDCFYSIMFFYTIFLKMLLSNAMK